MTARAKRHSARRHTGKRRPESAATRKKLSAREKGRKHPHKGSHAARRKGLKHPHGGSHTNHVAARHPVTRHAPRRTGGVRAPHPKRERIRPSHFKKGHTRLPSRFRKGKRIRGMKSPFAAGRRHTRAWK